MRALGADGAASSGAPSGVPEQTKEMVAGGQYLSDSVAEVTFAVGAADSVAIEVAWPGGARSRVEGGVNRVYEMAAPGVAGSDEETVASRARP
jgi:hypothetical protein